MNNNLVTTDLFAEELFEELAEGGPNYTGLIESMSDEYDCDFEGAEDWIRSRQAREASIAIREKNTPSNYSVRHGSLFYINDPSDVTPSGSTTFALKGPNGAGAMAAASKRVVFRHTEELATGTSISTNKETINLTQAGLYQFSFSGRVSPFAFIPDLEVMPNLLSQTGATFTADNNAAQSAPVDVVLVVSYRPTPTAPAVTIYQTLGSVSILLSDYTYNRVRNVEGRLNLRLPENAAVGVLFQRRRRTGTVTVGSTNYQEALGFVKEAFTVVGASNPLIDGSNYLRVLRIA